MTTTATGAEPLPAAQLKVSDVMAAINYYKPPLKIGEGGFGQVFKGQLYGFPVAVKVLNIVEQRNALQDLHQEVKALGRVRHANIVNLVGYATSPDEKFFCIVYEYVGGGSFGDALRKHKSKEKVLRHEIVLEILQDVAQALAYVHALGVIHADIKPDNILLSSDPFQPSASPLRAQLCDFGLARILRQTNANTRTHTVVTKVGATEGYADPITLSSGAIRPKTDVYSMVRIQWF